MNAASVYWILVWQTLRKPLCTHQFHTVVWCFCAGSGMWVGDSLNTQFLMISDALRSIWRNYMPGEIRLTGNWCLGRREWVGKKRSANICILPLCSRITLYRKWVTELQVIYPIEIRGHWKGWLSALIKNVILNVQKAGNCKYSYLVITYNMSIYAFLCIIILLWAISEDYLNKE